MLHKWKTYQTFVRDESGAALVLWGVSFVIFFGIVALSFDLGRVSITQTELQSYADSVALAAAGELDGKADAIDRATLAAANLISDSKTFGAGGALLSGANDYTLTFLSDLPASDTTAITATTTDPGDARYARVVVQPSNVEMTFGAAFFGLTGNTAPDTTARASAVAGFTQYACDVTPLMFCLPPTPVTEGMMILLRSGGNGAAWGPGDFGFLDPSKFLVDTEGPCEGKNGAQLDACLLGAIGSITQCFSQRGVDTEPGQKVGLRDSVFNVRFDIYKAVMNGKKNDPDYAPAPNVIKGIVPKSGQCIGNSEEISPDTLGLPRDTCLVNGTCGRFGDGDWAAGRVDYVNTNYGGVDPHPSATTRYEYYLAEIGPNPASTADILSGLSETGRPQCSNHQSNDPKRRVVIAAGIDCTANPINGAETGVPVEDFYEVFLTEPVGDDGLSPPTLDLWVEVIGSVGPGGAGTGGSGGIFRDVVQLYR
ncbi:pilus assembly protein [Halocynthiibacter sp. C4]|uniref:pilus assembly protein n=1 Tax=Halocynthiibacter sp. C4 TaxID=2992758 RepID=UPI00237B22C4|nr:pilus assembly protein [Halocynthiibacter sp. C4]MDE0589522.1 pilus assembly protein [Halocynthiibacter sp. C4]